MNNNITIKKAAIINFISKYINVFIQLILNSILARLLTPDDYGVVAIINVFITFFTIIADMGIGPAIIQYKDLREEQISDIFIFTLVISIITSIGFIAFSHPIAMIYRNDVYIPLGWILSLGVLFNILNIVPNAMLLKDKKFKTLGIRTIIVSIASGIITIILALNGAKYYALAINSVIVSFFTFIFNYYYSKLKIYYKFSFESIRLIREFSTYQFGFNCINYFSRNLDNLLIGKFIGQVSLGYYDKAYRLMLYPIQNLTNVITPVLHPILSDYSHDKERIYNEYSKIVKILFFLGIFFSIFCYFSANEIITIMFGGKWIKSAETFKILSTTIWIQMVMSSTGCIFQSLGDTKNLFKVGVITTFINIIAIILGVISLQIEIVAICILISFSINLYITLRYLISKSLGYKLSKFLYELKSGIVISIIMIISLYLTLIPSLNIILSIIFKLIVSISSFVFGLLITNELNSIISNNKLSLRRVI